MTVSGGQVMGTSSRWVIVIPVLLKSVLEDLNVSSLRFIETLLTVFRLGFLVDELRVRISEFFV